MKVLVVGHGAREHALSKRLSRDGHFVIGYIREDNVGLESVCRDIIFDTSGYYDSQAIVRSAIEHDVDLIIPADETALFHGVADAARLTGIPCIGHSRYLAVFLEGMRDQVMSTLSSVGGARRPDGIRAESIDDILDFVSDYTEIVVKPIFSQYLAGEIGKVTFGKAYHLGGHVNFPAWVEKREPGIDFSIHYLVNKETTVLMGITMDYPFLDKDNSALTSGMGAVSMPIDAQKVLSRKLLRDCRSMVDNTLQKLREKHGHDLCGFVSAQFRKIGHRAVFTEFDCKPGNPEIISLLPNIAGDMGKVLFAVATGNKVSVVIGGTCCVAISLVPKGYPCQDGARDCILSDNVIDNPQVYLGVSGHKDGKILTGSGGSRSACINACGATIREARASAIRTATSIAASSGLSFRSDVGSDLSGTTATDRVNKSLSRLKARGGKRLMLRLTPEGYNALRVLVESEGYKTETEAINNALIRCATNLVIQGEDEDQ